MQTFKDTLCLTEKGWKDLKKAILACTLTNLIMLLSMIVSLGILSELLKPLTGEPLNTGNLWILFAAGLVIAAFLFLSAKNDYKKTYLTAYQEAGKTRIRIAEHLRRLPMSFFASKDLSELTTNMMADCRSMESMLSSTIPPLAADIITMTISCLLLAFWDWRMALSVFCTLPVSAGIILLSRKRQKALFEEQVDTNLHASDQIQEYLEGIKVIKSCNLVGSHFQSFNDALLSMKQIAIRVEFAVGVFICSANMILQAGLGIAIFVGTVLLTDGAIDFFDLMMFFLFSTRIYGPILAVMGQLSTLLHLQTVTKRMRRLLLSKPMEGKNTAISEHSITLSHVTFSYQSDAVIKDVSIRIPQGSVAALVGPSGSGKSTIIKLIARFWDVQKGQITIGGKDIASIQPEELMESMAFVFQDVILFNDTVFHNIQIGKESADSKQVMEAARAACCDSFIKRLPDGYDTVLGENGATLSGGERQRISIARAILKDAPIIILDEATSSLDPENERLVQQAISRLIRHKTVIMIAHRLRTVTDADQIIVLDHGKVKECGTHRQLLTKNGLYAKMYHLQQESADWNPNRSARI